MSSLRLTPTPGGDNQDADAPVPATTPRRRTLIMNTPLKRIALGVRRIFSKQDSTSTLLVASSAMPPSSPSSRRLPAPNNKLRLQHTKSNSALTTERDIFPPISEMFHRKQFDDLPCAKDIPRLVRRVVVVVDGEAAPKVVFSAPPAQEDGDTSLKRSLELTSQLVHALHRELDGTESTSLLASSSSTIVAEATDQTDAEQACRQLVALLGTEQQSATVRVLKTINQDLVAHCTCELKEHITSRFMTKDVRTAEGWRIEIKIDSKTKQVQVTHTRREQSLDVGGGPEAKKNHWEFEWQLSLGLNAQALEMTHAQLRVTDLFLSETIDPKLEAEIKHDLRVGESIF